MGQCCYYGKKAYMSTPTPIFYMTPKEFLDKIATELENEDSKLWDYAQA